MRARALTATLAVTAGVLMLTGCGGDNTAGPATGGTQPPASQQQDSDHNDADIAFAQAMIPHHAQAIEMARLTSQRALSPQVKDLGNRIAQAQAPEIETMTSWLRVWNAELPPGPAGREHTGGMGHMPGMMDTRQMRQLNQAAGAEFDRLFLQTMIGHHEGAIVLASTELAHGRNAGATRLARQIIGAQRAEIRQMQALLSQG